MIGETAPPFALKSVDGSTVRSDAMRGRWLVVHFGASW
jgi:peroxiredoxin